MRAVILAGGLGTRLRPLTFSIPKPLLPIGEKPILEIILGQLRESGFDEIVLAVGYRAELLRTYFGDGARFGIQINYVQEQERLGTAGPLGLVRNHVHFTEGESFLVMNGDILTALNFRDMRHYHETAGYELTVATRTFQSQLPFGTLQIDKGRIMSITEKPTVTYEINAGIYMFRASALDAIPPRTFFDMPDLINKMLVEGRQVGAYHFDDYWLAIERLEHIEQAEAYLREHGLPGAPVK